jgi:predicted MPP superfamily phosphohydrolase
MFRGVPPGAASIGLIRSRAMLKLRSTGRGAKYSIARGLFESAQSLLYLGGWPAWLLDQWGERVPEIRLVEHPLACARAGRPPLRLAFASDLHIGPLTPVRLLEAAFARLAALAPDVLVLGGDYVSLEVTPRMGELLQRLVAGVPAAAKVAVLGNHDLWTDHTIVERALERAGATVLVNTSLRLPPPHDDVTLVGLDDPWTGTPDADAAFAGTAGAGVRIAVVHAPEGYPFVRDRGAALMLCGHTHGGQVATPRGPIIVPGPLGPRWPAGLYDVDGLPLYVSRGLGVVELPVRLFAPPDVALFTVT